MKKVFITILLVASVSAFAAAKALSNNYSKVVSHHVQQLENAQC